MRHLVFALCLCVTAPLGAADGTGKSKPATENQRLMDKWIVRTVQLDGKPTPAQIGQKVGDIISIERKGKHLFLA